MACLKCAHDVAAFAVCAACAKVSHPSSLQLSSIVQDFLHSPGVDPSVERHFRDYLAIRSRSSNPRLESALNWTLFFYTVAAPFVALSLLSKLVGGSSASGREPLVQEPQAALPPVAPVRSSSSSKQERGSKREPGRQRVQGMSLLDPGTPHDQGEGRLDLLEEADRERVGIHVRAY